MPLFTGRLRGVILLSFTLGYAAGATEFFPLQDVRAGMHGVGKTVFSGGRIDEFDVEILGVLVGSPLATIGNDSCTMRKKGEV